MTDKQTGIELKLVDVEDNNPLEIVIACRLYGAKMQLKADEAEANRQQLALTAPILKENEELRADKDKLKKALDYQGKSFNVQVKEDREAYDKLLRLQSDQMNEQVAEIASLKAQIANTITLEEAQRLRKWMDDYASTAEEPPDPVIEKIYDKIVSIASREE